MTATASRAAAISFRTVRTAAALTIGLLLMLILAGQAKATAFGFAAEPAAPGLANNCQAGTGDERLKVTCTFGGAQNTPLSVGPNVNHANVRAVGHAGGQPSYNSHRYTTGGPGGLGGDVSGPIDFAAGTGTLYVNVGELIWPQGDYINPWSFGGGAPAGACYAYICSWGYQPGGGGGASDVRTISAADAGTLQSRLIVGAGGGGGGREGSPMGGGGAGGNAGEPGQGAGGSGGGGAGTADGGGSSGNGAAGSLGNGGGGGKVNSSDNTGGGGGGGWYGGGGGDGSENFYGNAGGGGGGGSNLVPVGGSAVTSATSNASVSVTYERAATSTTVSASDATSVYGSDITLTAAVRSDAGSLDGGTVQFYDGATALGAPQAVDPTTGDATLTGHLLAGGERTLTATYSGDAGYAPSASETPLTHSVTADASTTSLTVSAPTSTYSTPATLTATVIAAGGAPAAANGGRVQFYDGETRLSGLRSVSGGQATLSLQGLLSAGEHTLHAVYEGDASTSASESATVTHTAQREPTWSDLRSYSYSVSYGGSVMLEGSVRSQYGYQSLDQYLQQAGYGTDVGSVKLYDNGQLVTGGYRSPLYFGAGRLSFFAMPQTGGVHSYMIKFSGNEAFGASESYSYQSQVQVINVPSTTTLTSTRTGSHLGQERTLRSQVTVADGTAANGTLQFTDNGAPLGAAQPVGADGQAGMTTSQLGLGDHVIRAVYSPSSPYYLTSSSDALAQPVAKLTTSTTSVVAPENVRIGQALTLDAAISAQDAPATGAGSEAPTGTVVFSDGRTELGSQPLGADGHARLDIPAGLTAGAHVITVAYSGDTNRLASSTDPTALYVHRIGTTVALTLPDTEGDQFTFRAELTPDAYDSGATPTGDIAFYDGDTLLGRVPLAGATAGSPGSAELQLPALPVGGHAIVAVYDGDEQFANAHSARSLVIAAPAPDPTPIPVPAPPVVPPVVPPLPRVVRVPVIVPSVPRAPVPGPALVRSGAIEIMSERRALDGSFITVRLHCDGSAVRRCVGTLALRVGTRNGAGSDYRLTGGQVRAVRIRVPRSLLARVRRDWAAPALVVANATRQAHDSRDPRSVRKRIVIVTSDD